MPKSLKSIMVLDRTMIIFYSFEVENPTPPPLFCPRAKPCRSVSTKCSQATGAVILVTSFGKIYMTISCYTRPKAECQVSSKGLEIISITRYRLQNRNHPFIKLDH